MIVGIDASNLRAGGGVTHLVELLHSANPEVHGFTKVIVCAGSATLSKIEERSWLRKVHDPMLDRGLSHRLWWQRFKLGMVLADCRCDVLFVPGGSSSSSFRPLVALSQNLLPFEWRELARYGWSPMVLKLLLLRMAQARTFRSATGVVFLTEYARRVVSKVTGPLARVAIVPHGVNPRFRAAPRVPRREFSAENPCNVLYVSIVDVYKHQWRVVEAVAELRAAGIPVALTLVGPFSYGTGRLNATLKRLEPGIQFVYLSGAVPHEVLPDLYSSADIGVFASSCENMPIILMECMAAGLPMASSRMGPMPELLGDAGLYFDPEDSHQIAAAVRQLIDAPDLRARMAIEAQRRVSSFSWERCATETFAFLSRAVQTDLR